MTRVRLTDEISFTKQMELLDNEFAQIVKRHKRTIYTVCLMFSREKDELDDLFQEVLINIWKGLPAFRGGSKVDTWIWRVSLNTCIGIDRSKKRRGSSLPVTEGLSLIDDGDDGRQIRMLYDRIHRLQPFDRAIVLLWLENLPYEEIASIVGITVKNVSVRLFRIKEELKRMSNE